MHLRENERMFAKEWKIVSIPLDEDDDDDEEVFPLGLNNHRHKWWCLWGFFHRGFFDFLRDLGSYALL